MPLSVVQKVYMYVYIYIYIDYILPPASPNTASQYTPPLAALPTPRPTSTPAARPVLSHR